MLLSQGDLVVCNIDVIIILDVEVENGCYGIMKTNENISATDTCQFTNFIFIVQDIIFSIRIGIKSQLTKSRITVVLVL